MLGLFYKIVIDYAKFYERNFTGWCEFTDTELHQRHQFVLDSEQRFELICQKFTVHRDSDTFDGILHNAREFDEKRRKDPEYYHFDWILDAYDYDPWNPNFEFLDRDYDYLLDFPDDDD